MQSTKCPINVITQVIKTIRDSKHFKDIRITTEGANMDAMLVMHENVLSELGENGNGVWIGPRAYYNALNYCCNILYL